MSSSAQYYPNGEAWWWQCFSASGTRQLVKVEGKLKYRDILKENLVHSAQDLRLGWRFTFQQDSDPKARDAPHLYQRTSRNEGWLLHRLTSPVSGPKGYTWTHRKDYRQPPTSMYILRLPEPPVRVISLNNLMLNQLKSHHQGFALCQRAINPYWRPDIGVSGA